MAPRRHSHLAPLLIAALAACSAPAPTPPNGVDGAFVLDPEVLDCNGGNCPYEHVLAAAVGGGQVYVVHDATNGTNGPNQGFVMGRVDFTGAKVQTLATDSTAQGEGAELALSNGLLDLGIGSQAYEVSTTSPTAVPQLWPLDTNGGLIGLDVDPGPPRVAVYGSASLCGSTSNNPCVNLDDDPWSSAGGSVTGWVYRSTLSSTPSSANIQTTFDLTYSRHLFVADASYVYWISGAPDQVMRASRLDLSGMQPIVDVAAGKGATGLAVSPTGNTLAWSSMGDIFGAPQSPSCTIWKYGASNPVLVSQQFFCMGLAVDDTHAYFAVVSLQQETVDNPPQTIRYVASTAIGRVDLNGPATQTPKLVSVQSTQYYGPRRVMLDPNDPTYVYGIDSAFVVRVRASNFDP